jgi:hypothetical protein
MKEFDKDGKEVKVSAKVDKDRKAAFEAICKKAILVNMSRKQISNMPFDIQTSNDLCKTLGVTDNTMIQVRKLLFNPERLSKIRSLTNDALLMVWNHTRPWDNIGFRLLPMEYYDDFNETFGKIKDEFEEAVKEFEDNYENYVKESKKLLGKAFNKADYPDKAQLPNYFNLEIHTSKFPDIDDIRLNLSGPELVAMQEEITGQYHDTINKSINTLITMITSADGFDTAEVKNLINIIKSLNIADDAEINMKLAEITETLTASGVDLEEEEVKDDNESMMVMDDLDGFDDIIDDYGV